MTVSLSRDSDETPVVNARTVVSEHSGNIGEERQDCAVLESRLLFLFLIALIYFLQLTLTF